MEYKNYENPFHPTITATQQASFISKVYMWMSLALAITGFTAYFCSNSMAVLNLMFDPVSGGPTFLSYALLIGQLLMVFGLSGAMHKMTLGLATAVFLFYSFLNGMTLSFIFLVYTSTSIATTFFITAGTFAIMSTYGYFTKTDLTKIGKILMMALIGIILAMLVNIFLHNSFLDMIVSIIGIIIFVGLIAYDTQKLKEISNKVGDHKSETFVKASILGALSLYLDFINLFLYLLRFLGNRK